MKIQTNLNEQALTLTRSLLRCVVPAAFKPGSLGHRMRMLIHAGEQGSALVEFALILPMLLMLTTGLLVFGVAMNNYLQLTHAVNMAARTVSLDGHEASAAPSSYPTSDPCSVASTAVMNAVPGLQSANMTFSYNFNGIPASSTSCADAAGNLVSHTNVTVTATYPLNLSIYGKVFNQSNAVLQASATELVQ
jgi:Flp pilus assembly protein TadG